LSEEVKMVYFKEKLNDARRRERSGWIMFVVGVFVAAIGFAFIPFIGQTSGILIGIGGVLLAIVGIIESFYFRLQHFKLMEQLEKMAIKTTCPKCGKEIPKGNFMFCPFCGASLERKPET